MSFSKRILIYIAGQSLWLIFFRGVGQWPSIERQFYSPIIGKDVTSSLISIYSTKLTVLLLREKPKFPCYGCLGTILELPGRKAKLIITKIIWLRGKKIFLPLRNTDSVSGNHFINVFLFNPRNSARWILLFTFYRWERWSSKAAQLVIFIGF